MNLILSDLCLKDFSGSPEHKGWKLNPLAWHWRLHGLAFLPFWGHLRLHSFMLTSYYIGDQGMEGEHCAILNWKLVIILGGHEWRALFHFQVTWIKMVILDKTECILSYKKDQWKGMKFFIFPFLQNRSKKSRKNWINWVHIKLNTLKRYDAI